MAELTAADLAAIRDEIGEGTDPSTTELRKSFTELGHWMLVALRVLRRRRAALTTGGDVTQVNLPGAIGVTIGKPDLSALIEQIDALQARYDAETGAGENVATAGRLTRRVPR